LNTLGKRFRHLRETAGATTRDFAKLLDISQGYVSQIERDTANLSPKTLTAIAAKLNVSPSWLLTGEGTMYPDPSIALSRHTDRWVQTFLAALVECWNSGDFVAVFAIDEGFEAVFDNRWLSWATARRPAPSAAELQFIPQLNDLHKAADDERLVEVAPSTARLLTRLLSLLAYSRASDYCDFLKEWWDAATDDEHAWARVELKRRLPMLF
jgi:transcriptional regulator with XRE-family HTH domain